MKNKKGFIATSMIYSFFLVFLMLMVTILANSINNRILVGRIKEDIRSEIDAEASFAVDVLPSKNYAVSEVVRFAGEDWNVITDKGSTVVLVLNRALNKQEIVSAIREEGNITNICTRVGFSNASHFINTFRQYTGVTPRAYLKRYASSVSAPMFGNYTSRPFI